MIGKKSGHAVDPNKYRAQNEKITDKARMWFEKVTGKKVCNPFMPLDVGLRRKWRGRLWLTVV